MSSLRDRLLATGVAGVLVAVLATGLEKSGVSASIALGLSLAAFSLVEKLATEILTVRISRRTLREILISFFDKLAARDAHPPPWEELQECILPFSTSHRSPFSRQLLRDALAEISLHRAHTSFIALDVAAVPALSELRSQLER
jgi:hypothetical protein